MKGMLLAAGRGSRLRPLTDTIPKPMVPLCGRPCIEPVIEWLAEHGVTEIATNTHWLPDQLQRYLGDGRRWGVRLTRHHEETLLEGIGTLKSFADFFGDDSVVCVNGDIVFDLDLADVLATHHASGAAMTLVTVPFHGPLPHPVLWDSAGRVRAIRRTGFEGRRGDRIGVFTGISVVEPEIWREHVPAGVAYHLAKDLLPRLFERDVPVGCHRHEGLWADIGTREDLDRAHALVLHHRCQRYLRDATEFEPDLWVERDVTVRGALRPPVFLGAGSVVGRRAVVGPYGAVDRGRHVHSREMVRYGVALAAESLPE